MSLDVSMAILADELGPGQHTGLLCPSCGSPDRAMSMLVDPPAIKAVCHRASCGYKYSNDKTPPNGGASPYSRSSRVKPYTGALHTLDLADISWLSERFELNPQAFGAMRKSEGRYFLPVNSPEGTRRGWIARKPWDGAPIDRGLAMQKVVTYLDTDEACLSWYPRLGKGVRYGTVLVEDQMSALKLQYSTYHHDAVALLGTGINEEKVEEIQRHAKHVLIALDADATGQAFAMARKWGQAFETCRVIILKHDIKDTDAATIKKIFS